MYLRTVRMIWIPCHWQLENASRKLRRQCVTLMHPMNCTNSPTNIIIRCTITRIHLLFFDPFPRLITVPTSDLFDSEASKTPRLPKSTLAYSRPGGSGSICRGERRRESLIIFWGCSECSQHTSTWRQLIKLRAAMA